MERGSSAAGPEAGGDAVRRVGSREEDAGRRVGEGSKAITGRWCRGIWGLDYVVGAKLRETWASDEDSTSWWPRARCSPGPFARTRAAGPE